MFVVEDWGRVGYAEAFERQKRYVEERICSVRKDTLIFVEHSPVFTLGARIGGGRHLLWNEERLDAEGIEVIKTNRGGDITYHGPGQVVCYAIFDLRGKRDLHAWLRFLETIILETLAEFGLSGQRREGMTGIWIENRKIAAIGVAVRQWVSYHGFALNVSPNLKHFSGIVPCGISSDQGTVTSMEKELDAIPSVELIRSVVVEQVGYHFKNEFRV